MVRTLPPTISLAPVPGATRASGRRRPQDHRLLAKELIKNRKIALDNSLICTILILVDNRVWECGSLLPLFFLPRLKLFRPLWVYKAISCRINQLQNANL